MSVFPGFNTIHNAPEFTDVQRSLDKNFYGMTSEFSVIFDGWHKQT